jgi:hypothetical protein
MGRRRPSDQLTDLFKIEIDTKECAAVTSKAVEVKRPTPDAAVIDSKAGEVAVVGKGERLELVQFNGPSVQLCHVVSMTGTLDVIDVAGCSRRSTSAKPQRYVGVSTFRTAPADANL